MKLRIAAATFVAMISGLAASGAACAQAAPKPASPATAKPAPAKPVPNAMAERSGDFWTEMHRVEVSEDFSKLQALVASKRAAPPTAAPPTPAPASIGAAPAPAPVQQTRDVAVLRPADAAVLLSQAATGAPDDAKRHALETMISVTTSPSVREQATAYVAPTERQRVESWNANLSSGVNGLPGVYLSDQPVQGDAPVVRSSAPSGYTPVSGNSFGCPAR